MQTIERLKGIFSPIVSVNSKDMPKLVNHLVDGKVNGIFVNGTTGEFFRLNREERRQRLESVISCVTEETLILGGVTDQNKKTNYNSVMLSIQHNIEDAIEAGAHVLVICPLFYSAIHYKNIVSSLEEITTTFHDQVFILYDNLGIQENRCFDIGQLGYLSQIDNIVGIKVTSNDQNHFNQVLKLKSERFRVFQGYEAYSHASLIQGADGIVASLVNIFPSLFSRLYNKPEAIPSTVDQDIAKLANAIYQPDVPTGIKRVLAYHCNLIAPDRSLRKLDKPAVAAIREFEQRYPCS